MSEEQIVKAWSDESYWLSLSEAERAQVPANPAGSVELMDAELERVVGGSDDRFTQGFACLRTRYTCDHCNYTGYSGGDTCCD